MHACMHACAAARACIWQADMRHVQDYAVSVRGEHMHVWQRRQAACTCRVCSMSASTYGSNDKGMHMLHL